MGHRVPSARSCATISETLGACNTDSTLDTDLLHIKVFREQCFIAFESDEEAVYRMWDHYEDVALWSSDYPHHDAEDVWEALELVWEALELMERHKVPTAVRTKLLGENARRLYGIEPTLVVTERIGEYEPAKLPW